MELNYDAPIRLLMKILDDVENQNKFLESIKDFIGVGLFLNEQNKLELEFSCVTDEAIATIKNNLNKLSNYQNNIYTVQFEQMTIEEELIRNYLHDSKEALKFDLNVLFRISEIPIAHDTFRVGSAVSPENSDFGGTYGWVFQLDGNLCGISNWHVLCENGNQTNLGINIEVDGENEGTLIHFENIDYKRPNLFDLAIFQITSEADALIEFDFNCDFNIPTSLEFNPRIGEVYRTVGAKQANCNEGKYIGLSSSKVDNNGRRIYYRHQMVFPRITDPGDSGSIAFNKQTNEVAGLMVGGNKSKSYANPLFYYGGWRYLGTTTIQNSDGTTSEVAQFITNDNYQIMDSKKSTEMKEIPLQIGGPSRKGILIDFSTINTKKPIIIGRNGDWIRLEWNYDNHPSRVNMKYRGWTYASSGKIWADPDIHSV